MMLLRLDEEWSELCYRGCGEIGIAESSCDVKNEKNESLVWCEFLVNDCSFPCYTSAFELPNQEKERKRCVSRRRG